MAKEAKTMIRVPDVDGCKPFDGPSEAFLHLYTDKASGSGIYSAAAIEFYDANGDVSFAIGGDFRVTMKHDRRARATQAAIDKQHAEVFTEEAVAVLLGAVREHYAAREQAA